ncbi:hypothetical protein [Stieleria varia]|nr:hypothetical protein [Stieleria varia]
MSKVITWASSGLLAIAAMFTVSGPSANADFGLRPGQGGYYARMPSYRPILPSNRTIVPTYRYNSYSLPVYPSYRSHWNGYHPRRPHLDYHGPSLVPHGNHYDYVPGHYDLHHGNHFHH